MKPWRSGLVAVVVFILWGTAPFPTAGAAAGREPEGAVIQWNPSESYPWGSQWDPRLDRPVAIWRTAILLADVFVEIKRQTGVEARLWSLDGSARELSQVRLNLYLGSKDPPSLRSVLAQLSWVLDYAIAYRAASGRLDTHYDLLCSDPGPAALSALATKMGATVKRQEDRLESYRRTRAAKLAQYHDAFGLDRDELVARYQDVDDALLFDLTDASHRAAISFLLGLPVERIQAYLRDGHVSVDWDALDQAQQALLTKAFPAPACPVAEVEFADEGKGAPWVSLLRSPETPSPPGAEDRGWGLPRGPFHSAGSGDGRK